MHLVARQTIQQFLVELEEDEIDAVEKAGFEVVRAEGSAPANVPRLWIEEGEMLDLVTAVYGVRGREDFVDGVRALRETGRLPRENG